MHFLLYVCTPADGSRTSLQARRNVCRYLNREHFVSRGRFCGVCDYFSVGGRYSGMLNLLRLQQQHPRKFKQFFTQNRKNNLSNKEDNELNISWFSEYEGMTFLF
jgi:hypothetical protein